MSRESIQKLVALCKEKPYDADKIRAYIANENLDSYAITRAAIDLCDYGRYSRLDYVHTHNTEPKPEELITHNWEDLFDIFIENGLDANIVFEDGENIMASLNHLDDGDLSAGVLRKLLSRGGSPNTVIEGTSFFEEIDGDFVIDIGMGLYPYEWQLDNAFKFWLVLVAFGGVIQGGKCPVNMCGDRSPEIFKEFERFDFKIEKTADDWTMHIFDKATGTDVATL